MLGLPIFAGGTAGIAKLAGPTGGYLLGYLPAVFVIGFLSEKLSKKPLCSVLAMIAGALIILPLVEVGDGHDLVKRPDSGIVSFFAGRCT